MRYRETLKEVAKKNNLPVTLVDKIYLSYFKFIKTHIQEFPLNQDLTEEELRNMKTNFNIKGLGKFEVVYKRHKQIRGIINRKAKYATFKNKED